MALQNWHENDLDIKDLETAVKKLESSKGVPEITSGTTLWYQIIVQQILLFFWQNAYLHALISSYTIIYFSKKILPTQLFYPTQLFISFKNLGNSKFSALFKPLITTLGQSF